MSVVCNFQRSVGEKIQEFICKKALRAFLIALLAAGCTGQPTEDIESATEAPPVSGAPNRPQVLATLPVGPANNNSPSVVGTAQANATVKIFSDGSCTNEVASGSANSSGYFSIAISVADNTTITFFANATNDIGTSPCSLTSISYIEDSAAPLTPLLSGVTPVGPANYNSPTVTGSSEAGATVKLYSDSSCTLEIGSGLTTGAGNFSVVAAVLDNTITSIYAAAVDLAGNTSACSASFLTFIEDSLAPTQPSIVSSTPPSPADNNNPVLNGTAEANSVIQLYSDSICTNLISTGTADVAGLFSITVSVVDNSTTNIFAKSTDAAGNSSICSTPAFQYIEDSGVTPVPNISGSSPLSPANNNSPYIEGTAISGNVINLYSDSSCTVLLASGVANGSGNFSIAISVLDNSSNNIYAKAINGGSSSNCTAMPYIYIEDSAAPSVPTVASVSPVGPANNNNPTVSGLGTANETISLYDNATCTGASLANGTIDGSGNFSLPISVFDNTTTLIYAKSVDLAGNSSTCSSTFITYVEDSSAPTAPVISSSLPTSPVNNNSPTLQGSSEANVQIKVYTDALCTNEIANVVADGVGAFSIAVSVLDNTSNNFYAKAFDFAGNSSTCSTPAFVYIEDSLAPNAPTLFTSVPISPANNNSPNLVGATEPNATVNLYSDSACTVSLGTANANSSGDFTISINVTDDTTTTVYSQATDVAGNTGVCSASSFNYIEDSLAPLAPVLTGSTPISPANNNNPTILGTAEANANITLFSDSSCTTSIASGLAIGGVVSVAITVGDNSSTSVYAKATDVAGNSSACSLSPYTYVEDSTNPNLPVLNSILPLSPANNNAPTISGTSDPNTTVKLYSNSSCSVELATGNADGSGNFAIPISVADNTSTNIYAKAFDASNNSSSCTTLYLTYIEDSLAPNAPVLMSSSPVSPANHNSPTISGTAEANSIVNLYSDSSCTMQVAAGTASGTGSFSISISVADNTLTSIYAKATDAANNISSCSLSSISYIEDSLAPVAPTLTFTIPYLRSDSTSPTVQGTSEANSTVTIYSDSSCLNSVGSSSADGSGSFSVTISIATLDQVITYYATATDLANNKSNCTLTGLNYEAYSIPSGIGFFQGAQTTLSSANLNQAEASIQWSNADFDSSYYLHSTQSNSHQVVIQANGDYLLSVNLPVNSALASGSIKVETRINGTPYTGAVGYTYTLNSNGHAESSTSYSVLLEGLVNGDVIDVTVSRAGSAGTITASGYASLYIENIDVSREIFTASATQTTNSTNLNGGTAYGLSWTDSIKDSGFTHSNSVNKDQITLTSSGDYLVHLVIPTEGALTNGAVKAQIQLNGVTVQGGEAKQGYISNSSGHTKASLAFSGIITAVAGQVLTVKTLQEAAAGTINIVSGHAARIFIEKIDSSTNMFLARGATPNPILVGGSANFNQNSATAIQFSTNPFKDPAVYTHSVASNSQEIIVQTAGDYLIHFNNTFGSAVNRGNVRIVINVNGVAASGAESKSNFIRNTGGHTESSGALVFYLRRLSANDVITVTTQKEAANVTLPAQDTSLHIVHKPY